MQGNDLGLRQHPDAQSFAALTHEQQIAFLTQVERTPFFERVRLLTLLGMRCRNTAAIATTFVE
jgi:hypothetical protein